MSHVYVTVDKNVCIVKQTNQSLYCVLVSVHSSRFLFAYVVIHGLAAIHYMSACVSVRGVFYYPGGQNPVWVVKLSHLMMYSQLGVLMGMK